MASNDGEAIAGLIGIAVALVAIYLFIVYVVLPLVIIFSGSGILFGGGVAIRNYVRSFGKNVAFQKI